MNLIAAPVCTSTLLVGDAQCDQIQHLLRGSKTPVLALESQTSALAEISAALQPQREQGSSVRTLHLFAHGRPERCASWDTRTGPGSDSLTGEVINHPFRPDL